MSNGEACCALEICCGAVAARHALATEIAQSFKHTEKDCAALAEWILSRYDLAPAGTLQPLKTAIADMVRHHPAAL